MASAKKRDPEGITTIAENRRATFDYAISETFECGLELVGSEVKSLRAKQVSFTDAYALVKDVELILIGMKIEPFKNATHEQHEPDRTRRLLLHKSEIEKLHKLTRERGLSLVPMKIYFKGAWAKVLVGVGKGKSHGDKREDVKRREADRDVARAMRRG
jgi:SsrA-binding protein